MNKILLISIFLFVHTTALANSQLKNDLCAVEKELSSLNNPNNLPEFQYEMLQNIAKTNLEKAKSMAGITCPSSSSTKAKDTNSSFKWLLDKTEEEKVQRYKEAMLRASNVQPLNQAKYNLCKIQLKWELAWKNLSDKDQHFYEWTLKEKFEEVLGKEKHSQCMSFVPQKVIDNISEKLGVATFKRSKKHMALNPKYPNGYEEGGGYAQEETLEEGQSSVASTSPSLNKFSPLIQFCDMKKTTYEREKCEKNIPIKQHYIVEGVVSNIISEKKFILRLASDQYANIYGNFDEKSMQHLVSLSNTGNKFSFIGELKALGTGIVFKHDFNYISPVN